MVGSLVLGAGVVYATDYTWDGGSPTDNWRLVPNWNVASCYPGFCNDSPNARIPWVSGANAPFLDGSLTHALGYVEIDAASGPITFSVNTGASFDPGAFNLFGGSSGSSKAILDYNVAGFSTDPDSITMRSYAEIDAEANITTAGALTVDTDMSETVASIDMGGATTLTVGSFVISGGPSETAQLSVPAGTVVTQ